MEKSQCFQRFSGLVILEFEKASYKYVSPSYRNFFHVILEFAGLCQRHTGIFKELWRSVEGSEGRFSDVSQP